MKKGTIKNKRCEICDKSKATTIIRTYYACELCFYILRNDNFRKAKGGIEITDSKRIQIECSKFKCKNKISREIKYLKKEGNRIEMSKRYCSKKCREADKFEYLKPIDL